jgi:oxygen-independent coproporphyrinogen-3 oxidase
LPDEEGAWEIQDAGAEQLQALGYRQYEVSAWAVDEQRRCRHNVNYWQFGDYLAAGAGAHGKISRAGGIMRYSKPANPLQYMLAMEGCSAAPQPEMLSDEDLVFEFMLNALRLVDGFPESLFTTRTGLTAEQLGAAMRGPIEKGLVERDGGKTWKPTALGLRFLNDLQAEFLRNS